MSSTNLGPMYVSMVHTNRKKQLRAPGGREGYIDVQSAAGAGQLEATINKRGAEGFFLFVYFLFLRFFPSYSLELLLAIKAGSCAAYCRLAKIMKNIYFGGRERRVFCAPYRF